MSTITITASPTSEQIIALSALKGYPEEVTIFEDIITPYEKSTALDGTIIPAGESRVTIPRQVPNPQSREDYLRQIYEGIISADIANEFLRDVQNKRAEMARLENEALRASINSIITSEVV